MFVDVSREGLVWYRGQVNSQARGYSVGLGIERKYVWLLVIVIIFMGFGGAKR